MGQPQVYIEKKSPKIFGVLGDPYSPGYDILLDASNDSLIESNYMSKLKNYSEPVDFGVVHLPESTFTDRVTDIESRSGPRHETGNTPKHDGSQRKVETEYD